MLPLCLRRAFLFHLHRASEWKKLEFLLFHLVALKIAAHLVNTFLGPRSKGKFYQEAVLNFLRVEKLPQTGGGSGSWPLCKFHLITEQRLPELSDSDKHS